MRHRRLLTPALLLAALGGALAGCSDENKDNATAPLRPPAPAEDTTKPGADKPVDPKPVPDQPPLKN